LVPVYHGLDFVSAAGFFDAPLPYGMVLPTLTVVLVVKGETLTSKSGIP
jgi:hypothetical protein